MFSVVCEGLIMSDTAKSESKPNTRIRSTIEFPYNDLESAEQLAEAMHREAGYDCTTDQLAGFLGTTGSSGSFRQRLSTARVFGLIETQRGGIVQLTDLGSRIVDQSQRREALVEAFLTVPLYSAIYDKFKSKLLPPRKGLEREMESLGVSAKQKDRARQAFERSARHAGFFAQGEDRLVEPVTRRGKTSISQNAPPPSLPTAEIPSASAPREFHPFVQGLLESLPPPGTEWPIEDQAKWLTTAAGIFGLIYTDAGGDISISVKKTSRTESDLG